MNEIENIIYHAWNKDAVNLKAAINDVMAARADAAVNDMTADVAASMFGATAGEANEDSENLEPVEVETDEDI